MFFRCRGWAAPGGSLSGPSVSWIVCCSHIPCGCSCHWTKTPPSTSCSESLLGCVQVSLFKHIFICVKLHNCCIASVLFYITSAPPVLSPLSYCGDCRRFWYANAAPPRGRCCVWEWQQTKVPPLWWSASSVRRTPVSIKQIRLPCVIPMTVPHTLYSTLLECGVVHRPAGWSSVGRTLVQSVQSVPPQLSIKPLSVL